MIHCSCGGSYEPENQSAIDHFKSKLHCKWNEWQVLIPEMVECPCGKPYNKRCADDVINHFKAPLHRKWEEWNVMSKAIKRITVYELSIKQKDGLCFIDEEDYTQMNHLVSDCKYEIYSYTLNTYRTVHGVYMVDLTSNQSNFNYELIYVNHFEVVKKRNN